MSYGCDTATKLDSIKIDNLIKENYKFVGRYLAGRYAMDLEEVQKISSKGIYIISIWEKGAPIKARYFTQSKGISDAEEAIWKAKALGQPKNTPIYFAVDFDASIAEVRGEITEYMRAVQTVFENTNYYYKLGIYGSGYVCNYFQESFTYTWLAGSSGWKNSKTYTKWCLKQYANNTKTSGGFRIDKNQSNGAAGGWRLL